MSSRDFLRVLILFGAITALLSPGLFTHQVYFAQDLTHVNHPWRVMTAEALQRGQFPLWNPYASFGIPLLGNFQTGVFYPLSLVFDCFHFSSALGPHLLLVDLLGAVMAYLWLRRLGLPGTACLTGACVFSAGGFMMGNLQFINALGSLALWPALFLFSDHPVLLALAASLALLSGHPPDWIGMCASFFVLRWAFSSASWKLQIHSYLRMTAAMAGALLLAAALLLPGLELISRSRRGEEGVKMSERTGHSLLPYELTALVHPDLTRRLARAFLPQHPMRVDISWDDHGIKKNFTFYKNGLDPLEDTGGLKITSWKSCYIGFGASMLALLGLGLWVRKRKTGRAAFVIGYLAALCVLLLGSHTEASRWIWGHAYPLQFIRAPARMSYLWLGAAVPLAACGAASLGRLRAIAPVLVLAELIGLGWKLNPTLPSDYYSNGGELTAFLGKNLGENRYYRLPLSEQEPYIDRENHSLEYARFKEELFRTSRQKLYGSSNAPFHLAQASGGGYEPLIPADSDRVSDYFIERDKQNVVRQMRWAGVQFLLDRKPIETDGLRDRGIHLWHVYESVGPISRAYWLDETSGKDLEKRFSEISANTPAKPLTYLRSREDRFAVSGIAPHDGWLYIAETRYPGWEVYLNGKRVEMKKALDAFIKVKVVSGPIDARFVYSPLSWFLGLWISLASFAGLAYFGVKRAAGRLS